MLVNMYVWKVLRPFQTHTIHEPEIPFLDPPRFILPRLFLTSGSPEQLGTLNVEMTQGLNNQELIATAAAKTLSQT